MKRLLYSMFIIYMLPVLLSVAGEKKKPEVKMDTQKIFAALSAKTFNECWTYIEKEQRSPEDTENMLATAYASLWHWKQRKDCKPLNLSVGYWQVSRVNALAGYGKISLDFANKCIQISEKNALSPFYIGYGYEAKARALVILNNIGEAKKTLEKANNLMEKVEEAEEQKLLKDDLGKISALIQKK